MQAKECKRREQVKRADEENVAEQDKIKFMYKFGLFKKFTRLTFGSGLLGAGFAKEGSSLRIANECHSSGCHRVAIVLLIDCIHKRWKLLG